MAEIRCININKAFGEEKVLTDFNAVFMKGKPTCIMGASGRGKTTLLRIMMNLLPVDSGRVEGLENSPISAVFQDDRLLPEFNAVRNVKFAAPGVDVKKIIRHLNHLGLEESIQKPVLQLSGGMRRRVALVRAVLAPGDVIFLDEPLKGLDEANKVLAAEYLLSNTKGKTLIMVTHTLDEVKLMQGTLMQI